MKDETAHLIGRRRRMSEPNSRADQVGDEEVTKSIDEYLADHPEIQEALDVFQVSRESYEAAVRALQNRPIYSTSSTNEMVLRIS